MIEVARELLKASPAIVSLRAACVNSARVHVMVETVEFADTKEIGEEGQDHDNAAVRKAP